MKAQGKILILALAALLICGMGWSLLWSRREPWAKIQFTKAQFANGTVEINYHYAVSSGAFLRKCDFKNGVKTGDGGGGGSSLFGWPSSGGGGMSLTLYPSVIATSRPLLVVTGKTYILKLHDQLQVYDITNESGVTYDGRFALEPETK